LPCGEDAAGPFVLGWAAHWARSSTRQATREFVAFRHLTVQADGQLAEHASEKRIKREGGVGLLGGTGPDVVGELYAGLPQVPIIRLYH
jgi:hypothetical protein